MSVYLPLNTADVQLLTSPQKRRSLPPEWRSFRRLLPAVGPAKDLWPTVSFAVCHDNATEDGLAVNPATEEALVAKIDVSQQPPTNPDANCEFSVCRNAVR
jgi:hypothetical protein